MKKNPIYLFETDFKQINSVRKIIHLPSKCWSSSKSNEIGRIQCQFVRPIWIPKNTRGTSMSLVTYLQFPIRILCLMLKNLFSSMQCYYFLRPLSYSMLLEFFLLSNHDRYTHVSTSQQNTERFCQRIINRQT